MEDNRPKRIEDYTSASLVMIFVNLFWILGLIWATLGLPAVLLVGWILNYLITRLDQYRARREIKWPSDA